MKKQGTIKVCVDYSHLNKACPKDNYPIPFIDQIIVLMQEKIPSQQRGLLHIRKVPIRLMNVWCRRPDGIMASLPF